MTGTEIIELLSKGTEIMSSAVAPVAGAVLTAIYLRSNTQTVEFEKIKAGLFKEVIEDLLKSRAITYIEYYNTKNFVEIAEKADKYYKEHPRTDTQEKVDFDWSIRFFEAVGNISDEDMQNIWAKILAGEIAHPSTFSLKTIDILRNLSKQDAELFTKVYSHSFSIKHNIYIPNESKYYESVGIKFSDIMKLSELGLISDNDNVLISFDISSEQHILFQNQNLIISISSASGNPESVSLGAYPFTGAGKELSTLLKVSTSDEDLLKYGQLLSQNKKYKISLDKIIKHDKDKVKCDKTNLLDADEKQ